MCAKLRTVAASNNRDHLTRSLYYCLFAPHKYGVFLHAHPVRGESYILTQRYQRGCNNILSICAWREVRNFASQTFCVTLPVGESAKKRKSKVLAD